MSEALLTAIIFTYNHKKFISKCIDSIVNQKTSYKYEIHIWDDCSIDGTSDICREYAQKYRELIHLVVQEKNTFCYPGIKHQTWPAISKVKTKYMCIIDGDDWWCDENKIQIALDFLENHPDYVGFAHDTLQYEEFLDKKERSYIHEVLNFSTLENPIEFSADAPFFLTSARIFRTSDFVEKKILPIDYLFYYYHLKKGPIFYYDKIMSVYNIGLNSTFANMKSKNIINLTSLFAYKLAKLFNFQENEFCLAYQKATDCRNGIGDKRNRFLIRLQKIFGIEWGWHLWAFLIFVPKFGFECLDINYVYSRKKAKKYADNNLNNHKKPKMLIFKYKKASLVRKIILIGQDINCKYIRTVFPHFSIKFGKKLDFWLKRKNNRLDKIKGEMEEYE